MLRFRAIIPTLGLLAAVTTLTAAHPQVVVGAQKLAMSATLDGRPISLVDVAKYYCDDFAFPVITCSVNAAGIEARASAALLVASIEYVTIYESTFYSGTFMNVSQDYSALSFIGWNDRISSFKARNYETGRFWTDWFYSGTIYGFCCNQQAGALGGYDNTFSSIQRT